MYISFWNGTYLSRVSEKDPRGKFQIQNYENEFSDKKKKLLEKVKGILFFGSGEKGREHNLPIKVTSSQHQLTTTKKKAIRDGRAKRCTSSDGE